MADAHIASPNGEIGIASACPKEHIETKNVITYTNTFCKVKRFVKIPFTSIFSMLSVDS